MADRTSILNGNEIGNTNTCCDGKVKLGSFQDILIFTLMMFSYILLYILGWIFVLPKLTKTNINGWFELGLLFYIPMIIFKTMCYLKDPGIIPRGHKLFTRQLEENISKEKNEIEDRTKRSKLDSNDTLKKVDVFSFRHIKGESDIKVYSESKTRGSYSKDEGLVENEEGRQGVEVEHNPFTFVKKKSSEKYTGEKEKELGIREKPDSITPPKKKKKMIINLFPELDAVGSDKENEIDVKMLNEKNESVYVNNENDQADTPKLQMKAEYAQYNQFADSSNIKEKFDDKEFEFKKYDPNNSNIFVPTEAKKEEEIEIPPVFTERFCKTCNIIRPVKTSHCRVCDNCVQNFDHHCYFVGNCIGSRNEKHFYLFLFFGTLASLHFVVFLLIHLVLLFVDQSTGLFGEIAGMKYYYIISIVLVAVSFFIRNFCNVCFLPIHVFVYCVGVLGIFGTCLASMYNSLSMINNPVSVLLLGGSIPVAVFVTGFFIKQTIIVTRLLTTKQLEALESQKELIRRRKEREKKRIVKELGKNEASHRNGEIRIGEGDSTIDSDNSDPDRKYNQLYNEYSNFSCSQRFSNLVSFLTKPVPDSLIYTS